MIDGREAVPNGECAELSSSAGADSHCRTGRTCDSQNSSVQ